MKNSILSFIYSSLAVGGISLVGWVFLIGVGKIMVLFGI